MGFGCVIDEDGLAYISSNFTRKSYDISDFENSQKPLFGGYEISQTHSDVDILLLITR